MDRTPTRTLLVPVLLLLVSCTRYGYQPPLATDDGSVRDKHPATEQGPDSFVVPDAGCPPGFTQCGQVCADLLHDTEHCGGCDAPCPPGAHDACVDGECRCGDGPICTGGLNCVNGDCRCIQGGLCPGCCDGSDKCLPPGPCDDGNLCTTGDTCAAGTCKGAPVSCSHLDTECVNGICDPQTGECKAVNRPNGTFCPDDLYCTVGTTCQDGVCSGGKPRDCEDDCNTGTCDEQADKCVLTPKQDGTACNDNKQCTTDDACKGGDCEGVPKTEGTSCGSFGGHCCGTKCCSVTEPVCCASIDKCCSFGSACCGNTCCGPTENCCNGATCCNLGDTCCGNECCSIGQTCCGNVACCKIGYKCCPDYTCKLSCP